MDMERIEQMAYDIGYQRGYEKGKADRTSGEWISCSERLPRWDEHVDEMVLVCYGNGSVRFNTCMNGQWCQGNPLAWMPLPEPWRGADDE